MVWLETLACICSDAVAAVRSELRLLFHPRTSDSHSTAGRMTWAEPVSKTTRKSWRPHPLSATRCSGVLAGLAKNGSTEGEGVRVGQKMAGLGRPGFGSFLSWAEPNKWRLSGPVGGSPRSGPEGRTAEPKPQAASQATDPGVRGLERGNLSHAVDGHLRRQKPRCHQSGDCCIAPKELDYIYIYMFY